jgi:large subunit ribosomal protein L22
VLTLVRSGISYNEAMAQLTFSPKKSSAMVRKVLEAARFNAENNFGLDPNRLVVGMLLPVLVICD